MEENSMIQVFARCDERGCITDVNSCIFLADAEGWVQIDEGEGDRYVHAQSMYFDSPLADELRVLRYRVVGGRAEERPAADVEVDRHTAQAEADKMEAHQLEMAAMQQAAVTLAMLHAPELPDEQAIAVPALYPAWEELLARGQEVPEGERCRWGAGGLYKCLQAHVPQADWTPGDAPSLWVVIPDPAEKWPLIPNPIPATNPWMKGQKGRVADGRRYISLIDNNTWQPDEYPAGWEERI